jgi:NADH-quinone oxidoreductase subunit B
MTAGSSTQAVRYRLSADRRVQVSVQNVGLACCTMEVEAAILLGLLAPEADDDQPVRHTVLLVSGTVTDVLAPAVVRARDRLPAPVSVVAFGACASTGGPYWDAPTVTKGIDQLLPVETYVPGCPPRPEALIAGLLTLVAGQSA